MTKWSRHKFSPVFELVTGSHIVLDLSLEALLKSTVYKPEIHFTGITERHGCKDGHLLSKTRLQKYTSTITIALRQQYHIRPFTKTLWSRHHPRLVRRRRIFKPTKIQKMYDEQDLC